MKPFFLLAASFAITIAACTKTVDEQPLPGDDGCIDRVFIQVNDHAINSSDVATVHNLFTSNGIDDSRIRYYKYTHDTLQTLYPPYTQYDQKNVRADEFTNGLRIFNGNLLYLFLNNSFHFRGGNLTSGTSLDTLPKLSLSQIRKLFLNDIEQFDHSGAAYKNTCFEAEFGYFNLNEGISNSQEVLVKAWRVGLKNAYPFSIYNLRYPIAFHEDKDGKLIYYSNGIVSFK